MRKVARANPRRELHLVLDNSSLMGLQKSRRGSRRIRGFTSITRRRAHPRSGRRLLWRPRQSLSITNFPARLHYALVSTLYLAGWNDHPAPFRWTKPAHAIRRSHGRTLDRISVAVR